MSKGEGRIQSFSTDEENLWVIKVTEIRKEHLQRIQLFWPPRPKELGLSYSGNTSDMHQVSRNKNEKERRPQSCVLCFVPARLRIGLGLSSCKFRDKHKTIMCKTGKSNIWKEKRETRLSPRANSLAEVTRRAKLGCLVCKDVWFLRPPPYLPPFFSPWVSYTQGAGNSVSHWVAHALTHILAHASSSGISAGRNRHLCFPVSKVLLSSSQGWASP